VDSIGEEIARIGDQDDEAALGLGESAQVGKFQEQRGNHSDGDANTQASEENAQESANAFEEAENADGCFFGLVGLCSFEKHDSNGIVEDGLAEDDCVKLRIDLVGVENSEDGDGISGG
jgi:hypothetical protein